MGGQGCWLGMAVCCVVASGCAELPNWAQYQHSPAMEISDQTMPALVVRSQTNEPAGVKLQGPLPAPPMPTPPPPDKDVVQTSNVASRGTVRLSIRAWVNGKPIFDEELRFVLLGAMNGLRSMPEPERSQKLAELTKTALDNIIDQEVMYQDAIKRLSQAGKSNVDKLKGFVEQEFQKELKKWRANGATEAQIAEAEPIRRRLLERELVAMEYARTLIKPKIDCVSADEIQEYYETHKNQFMTVDRIEWQDVFIGMKPGWTIDDAKHFGEQLVNRCRSYDDFSKLLIYNEGLTKNSDGVGLGNLRGQIQPPELEEALFKLRPGEIGPIIPMATGIHIVRVTKREYAGQKPFDYPVQKAIRKKLESERADREYNRLKRDLRDRATIRIEHAGP